MKIIDAKYKLVRPKRPLRLYIDWRNFWLIALIVTVPLVARLLLRE